MNKTLIPRVIPCLLFQNGSLVKTKKFKNPSYVGDAINAIKIYNNKEVDELIFLDILASKENRNPNLQIIKEIATECFMPLCYGGGLRNLNVLKEIFNIGVEKVSINTYAIENPDFIKQAAREFGNQSIVVSIDVKKNFLGKYEVYSKGGTVNTHLDPIDFAKKVEENGAGEILLTSIDKEGTWLGFDIELIKKITASVGIPVIANGGAGKLEDVKTAVIQGGAHAVALGSMVVYQKKDLGVLINFPKRSDLVKLFT